MWAVTVSDLAWLFATAGAPGLSSNHGAIIAALRDGYRLAVDDEGATSAPGDAEDALHGALDASGGRAEGLRRGRRALAVIARLHPMHRATLAAAFEGRVNGTVGDYFGAIDGVGVAGVAGMTVAARAVQSYSPAWARDALVRQDGRLVLMRTQATKLLTEALRAYERASQRVGSGEAPAVEGILSEEPAPPPRKVVRKRGEAA